MDLEGYGPEERSWVPKDDILYSNLLAEFHTSHPKDPTLCDRGYHPRRLGFRPLGAGRGEGGSVTETHQSAIPITGVLITRT